MVRLSPALPSSHLLCQCLVLMSTLMGPVSSTGLYNMGGDPVTVIEEIRNLLDIGRDRKNPREDYLGE